ncbi:MAG: hypothetical protein WCT02_02255 [Candidatus Paceibacterota bacterium]
MKKIALTYFALAALVLPASALAITKYVEPVSNPVSTVQALPDLAPITDANGLFRRLAGYGNVAIYMLVALAVIFIVYNVVWYIIRPSEAAGKTEAGLNILWGLVGLFIIVSLWGLVNILVGTFGTDSNMPNRIPNADFINDQNPNKYNTGD